MDKEKSLEQFKKNINLMFEKNDKEIYLCKDDALKINDYIYSLEKQVKKQKEVIKKIMYKIENYTTLNEPRIRKELLDILKEVSE